MEHEKRIAIEIPCVIFSLSCSLAHTRIWTWMDGEEVRSREGEE
jgi:hypothetical protein